MNTTDFIHNLNSDDLSSIVVDCFDELMVLYNLVGDRQDLDICTETDASRVSFRLLMESEEDAKALYEDLNASSFSVYNNKFNINMEINGASILTIITKAAS